MSLTANTLKLSRQIHLYFGVFIAPALLFFALTGAMQTFNLHEASPGSSYKPARWIVTLAQLHKKQTVTVPVRKPRPVDKPAADNTTKLAPAAPAPAPKNHLPMKLFFLLVSIGLFTSTLTGIYMAYKFNRNKLIVTGLLLAGIVVPLLLLNF
jgi:hypothetical protein